LPSAPTEPTPELWARSMLLVEALTSPADAGPRVGGGPYPDAPALAKGAGALERILSSLLAAQNLELRPLPIMPMTGPEATRCGANEDC
jgi:hypothetical protein